MNPDGASCVSGIWRTSCAAIAAKVGKPLEYVTRRLKLLSLIVFSREALAEKLITIDHALLLSNLAQAEQETALRFRLEKLAAKSRKTADMLEHAKERAARGRAEYGGYWEPQSVLDLKRFIEDGIKLELERGTWPTRLWFRMSGSAWGARRTRLLTRCCSATWRCRMLAAPIRRASRRSVRRLSSSSSMR